MSTPDLSLLLTRTTAGDREALRAIYESMRQPVYLYVLVQCGGNRPLAEDVLQDTFIGIWESAPRYQPTGSAKAWILSIGAQGAAPGVGFCPSGGTILGGGPLPCRKHAGSHNSRAKRAAAAAVHAPGPGTRHRRGPCPVRLQAPGDRRRAADSTGHRALALPACTQQAAHPGRTHN